MKKLQEVKKLSAAKNILEHIGSILNLKISVRLWDGSMVKLGKDVDPNSFLSINESSTLTSILRWPSMETILLQYASGNIDFHGGDIYDFFETARSQHSKIKFRHLDKKLLIKNIFPLIFSSSKSLIVNFSYLEI